IRFGNLLRSIAQNITATAFVLADSCSGGGRRASPTGGEQCRSSSHSHCDRRLAAAPGGSRRFGRDPALPSGNQNENGCVGKRGRCAGTYEKLEDPIRSHGGSQPRPVRWANLMAEHASTPANSSFGSFDEYHPPSTDLVNECVHCGFCLTTCPTYALWGEEMDSPRGRIYLMKLGLEGKVGLDPTFVGHMDSCLGCMACMSACPSGVKYDKLIEATRAQIQRNFPRPAPDGLLRRMIFDIFPRPDRLRLLLGPLRMYQRSGLQSLMRRSGLLRLLPASVGAIENLTPTVPSKVEANGNALPERIAAQGEPRLRVGLLLGCVQSVFF